MNPIVNPSAESNSSSSTAMTQYSDNLNGFGKCGNGMPLKDDNGKVIEGSCGYGPRIPLLVISPYAKQNFVDHGLSDQSSIVRFIEDNWSLGGRQKAIVGANEEAMAWFSRSRSG